jgi:hypothetical protein
VAVIPLLGQLCAVVIGGSASESELAIGLQNLDRDAKRNESAWVSRFTTSGFVETTAVLPVDVDSIFAARCELFLEVCPGKACSFILLADGQLYRVPFSELASDPTSPSAENALGAWVTRLWIVTEEWSKELFLLGALDDGGIACWNAR